MEGALLEEVFFDVGRQKAGSVTRKIDISIMCLWCYGNTEKTFPILVLAGWPHISIGNQILAFDCKIFFLFDG